MTFLSGSRQPTQERATIEMLNCTNIPTASGRSVTVSQIAWPHFLPFGAGVPDRSARRDERGNVIADHAAAIWFRRAVGGIALFGMIIRNSVILIDQIEQNITGGSALWNAIVEAAVRRLRLIILTAAAAVLAMIPLSRAVFCVPMAVAIMGGMMAATALTLLFLPALYAAWLRVKKPA